MAEQQGKVHETQKAVDMGLQLLSKCEGLLPKAAALTCHGAEAPWQRLACAAGSTTLSVRVASY